MCQRWGEENFTFFEDDPHSRKYHGRIQVRKHDYYTRFEAWDAEHFGVQYHNSMTLLEHGLKMNDEDFAGLQTYLGISDAEFIHALKDGISHCKPSSAKPEEHHPGPGVKSRASASGKRLPAARSSHPPNHTSMRTTAPKVHARVSGGPINSVIKNQLIRTAAACENARVINNIQGSQLHTPSLSVASLAQPREERGDSQVGASSLQDNFSYGNKQKLFDQWPNKRARMQEPEKTTSLTLTPQPSQILTTQPSQMLTPQPSRITPRRRLCDPAMYGQGLKENRHKLADEETIRLDNLKAMFSELETASKASARNDDDGNIRLRTVLSYLFNTVQYKYPTEKKVTDFQNAGSFKFYWLTYNSFIKSRGALDPLSRFAMLELRDMANEGTLRREQELVAMREISQHIYRRFHCKWQEMVALTINAAHNLA